MNDIFYVANNFMKVKLINLVFVLFNNITLTQTSAGLVALISNIYLIHF